MLYCSSWRIFAKHLFKLVLFVSIFASILSKDPGPPPLCIEDVKEIFPRTTDPIGEVVFVCNYFDSEYFDFVFFADGGGKEDKDKKTDKHKPSPGQTLVAGRIQELIGKDLFGNGKNFHPEIVLNGGDNFYDSGIGPKDAKERFEKTFDAAYKDIKLPWVTIAGNNDYKVPKEDGQKIEGDDKKGSNNGDKQSKVKGNKKTKESVKVEKTDEEKKIEKNKNFEEARIRVLTQMEHTLQPNTIWKFPSEYYVHSYNLKDFNVVFVMIDTTLLCGGSRKDSLDLQKEGDLKDEEKSKKRLAHEKHFEWLEKTLPKYSKTADYLFVAGHYPLYMTKGGRSFSCAKNLRKLFAKHKISAYLAGHEHSLKYIQIANFRQVVSGAATKMENCLQEKHVLSHYEDGHTNLTINMAKKFKICHPAGLNETQKEENEKLQNLRLIKTEMLEEMKKVIQEVKFEPNEENKIPEWLLKEIKKELDKEMEKELDKETKKNGGFVATKKEVLDKTIKVFEEKLKLKIKIDQVADEDELNKISEKNNYLNNGLEDLKIKLKELEKVLDTDTFVNGGFVAVRVDKEYASFEFLTVGEKELKSKAINKVKLSSNERDEKENGIFSSLGTVKIKRRQLSEEATETEKGNDMV
ncbi:hypothetical protein ACQ4LE_000561 [Meloidogyne hapla]|uniref:Metallophos domain-containing protein n=1 Tax=Meloidogyne hapla TaxID=6305 RepID=A0A1I8BSK7_MELHA